MNQVSSYVLLILSCWVFWIWAFFSISTVVILVQSFISSFLDYVDYFLVVLFPIPLFFILLITQLTKQSSLDITLIIHFPQEAKWSPFIYANGLQPSSIIPHVIQNPFISNVVIYSSSQNSVSSLCPLLCYCSYHPMEWPFLFCTKLCL